MIRVKKIFMKPTALEIRFRVLFHLEDRESIERHKDKRRNHSLVNEEIDVIEEEVNDGLVDDIVQEDDYQPKHSFDHDGILDNNKILETLEKEPE